jgi:glycosyltransferase involved in cell wall biosynthesis
LPNCQTTHAYSLDGFCALTIRFAKLLKDLGHTVFLYASEENDAPCDELIPCITKEEQTVLLGKTPYQYGMMHEHYPLWALANPRMSAAIAKRKQARDFICTLGGLSQKSIADDHPDLMCVEYSIGYISSFARFRVYETHIWRHCTHGFHDDQQGRFFDTVIPCFYDETAFPFQAYKEPFVLYVGRLIPRKGITVACQVAQAAGVPLKVIGHGDPNLVTHGAVYLGALDDAQRNRWMARASALLAPTLYLEPFGQVAAEAQLCGTPVISTDFGGFVETVEHGVTGFRCTYVGEFVDAIHAVADLDPRYIRDRAIRIYSQTTAAVQYQRYFERLSLLWRDGWDSLDVLPSNDRIRLVTA